MKFIDILAPASCAFCGQYCIAAEHNICAPCLRDLPWTETAASPVPGLFTSSIAMLDYAFPVDAAIKALKFDHKLFYGAAFAEILLTCRASLPPDIDALLPVPLHWWRKTRRGFNQSVELAKPLANALGVPIDRCVRRHRPTPPQTGLDARQRAANLRGAFAVRHAIVRQHYLLVDDVLTTGATTEAIAKVLLSAGAPAVSRLTVARAKG